jgi:hypothetical protein
VIEMACEGLNITPEQLRHELEAGGDLPNLVSGALTPEALWLTAKTLALMHDQNPPCGQGRPDLNRKRSGE